MKSYFDQEKGNILKSLLNSKSSKKSKQMIKELTQIPEMIRDAVMTIYIQRCKISYTIKFIQWRLAKLKFENKPIDP